MIFVFESLYKGNMHHYASKPAARRWTGDLREKAKQVLQHKLPAAARLEFLSEADMKAVRNGRLTGVTNLKAFQNMKDQVWAVVELNFNIIYSKFLQLTSVLI